MPPCRCQKRFQTLEGNNKCVTHRIQGSQNRDHFELLGIPSYETI